MAGIKSLSIWERSPWGQTIGIDVQDAGDEGEEGGFKLDFGGCAPDIYIYYYP